MLAPLFSSPHVLDIFNGFAICESSALCLHYTMTSSSLGRPLIWDTVAFLHDAGSAFVLQRSLIIQGKKWVVWGDTCLSFSDVEKTCRYLEVIWKILTAFFSCLPRPLCEKLKLRSKFKGDFWGACKLTMLHAFTSYLSSSPCFRDCLMPMDSETNLLNHYFE